MNDYIRAINGFTFTVAALQRALINEVTAGDGNSDPLLNSALGRFDLVVERAKRLQTSVAKNGTSDGKAYLEFLIIFGMVCAVGEEIRRAAGGLHQLPDLIGTLYAGMMNNGARVAGMASFEFYESMQYRATSIDVEGKIDEDEIARALRDLLQRRDDDDDPAAV